MAQVITLSGMEKSANVPSKHRKCTPVTVDSTVLGRSIKVCQEDLLAIEQASELGPGNLKLKRIRRKYTRKHVKPCQKAVWYQGPKGKRCKCVLGNKSFVSNDRCNNA
jgi:hypothetical protein